MPVRAWGFDSPLSDFLSQPLCFTAGRLAVLCASIDYEHQSTRYQGRETPAPGRDTNSHNCIGSASVEIHEHTTNRPLFCCRELNFSMDSQRLIDHQQAIVQAVPTSVLADVCPRVSVERVIYLAVLGGSVGRLLCGCVGRVAEVLL